MTSNLKIGIIDYFGTGEGRTIYIFCNLENKIPESIDSYFHDAIEYISANVLDDGYELKGDEHRMVRLLNEYADSLCSLLRKHKRMNNIHFFQEFHINLF
jgi:hypothetical protein